MNWSMRCSGAFTKHSSRPSIPKTYSPFRARLAGPHARLGSGAGAVYFSSLNEKGLEAQEFLAAQCIRVNEFENQSQTLARDGVAEAFAQVRDTIELMRHIPPSRRDSVRRMAHCSHHGAQADAFETSQRLLRRNRGGGLHPDFRAPGIACSTTHCIAGAIAGVGAVQRVRAVRWGVAANILWAWVLTIPAAAVMASVVFTGIHVLDSSL